MEHTMSKNESGLGWWVDDLNTTLDRSWAIDRAVPDFWDSSSGYSLTSADLLDGIDIIPSGSYDGGKIDVGGWFFSLLVLWGLVTAFFWALSQPLPPTIIYGALAVLPLWWGSYGFVRLEKHYPGLTTVSHYGSRTCLWMSVPGILAAAWIDLWHFVRVSAYTFEVVFNTTLTTIIVMGVFLLVTRLFRLIQRTLKQSRLFIRQRIILATLGMMVLLTIVVIIIGLTSFELLQTLGSGLFKLLCILGFMSGLYSIGRSMPRWIYRMMDAGSRFIFR
jgi:hypothetical protein